MEVELEFALGQQQRVHPLGAQGAHQQRSHHGGIDAAAQAQDGAVALVLVHLLADEVDDLVGDVFGMDGECVHGGDVVYRVEGSM